MTEGAVSIGTAAADVSGVRHFAAGTADADAVQVVAQTNVTQSLVAGGWFTGTVPMRATAVARRRQPTAGFSLGSFLVSVNSGDVDILNQLLGGMLGSGLNLQLVSYQGLAAAHVTLGGLVQGAQLAGVSLAAGTVQGLLNAQVSIADLVNIMLHAVDSSDPAYTALDQLLIAAGGNAGTFRLGDLIQVTATDPNSGQDAIINVGTLLTAGIQMADKQRAISLPITMTLPANMGSAHLWLYIIEPPHVAVGPPGQDTNGQWRTQATTAQVRFQSDVTVTNLPLPLVNVSGTISVWGSAASANGHLASIRCASMAQPTNDAGIGVTTSIADIGVGRFNDITAGSGTSPSQLSVTAAGIPVATVTLSGDANASDGQSHSLDFASTPSTLPMTQTVGTNVDAALAASINSLSSLTPGVTVLTPPGLPVGVTTSALQQEIQDSVLSPALSALNTGLLSQLLRALGVNLGGADVELIEVDDDATRLVI